MQAFLWSYDLAPCPSPPVGKLDQRHTGRLRKRETTCWEGGWERSRVIRPQDCLVLYKSFYTLCYISLEVFWWKQVSLHRFPFQWQRVTTHILFLRRLILYARWLRKVLTWHSTKFSILWAKKITNLWTSLHLILRVNISLVFNSYRLTIGMYKKMPASRD